MHDTNHKGNVAEAAIAAAAIKLGVDVSKPLVEHTRYDLIFDVRPPLLRVQCKWAPVRGDVVVVNLTSTRYTRGGDQIRTYYSPAEIDAVAAYCEKLDRCYLLPIRMIDGMRGVQLRLAPPLNAQRAALNWAADYELDGAIAQLGERLRGTQEGAGSSPASSTSPPKPPARLTVGSNDFHRRFGWYAQRVAAGDDLLVTRRGKPYVRLIPANDQRPLLPRAQQKPRPNQS